MGEDKLNMPPPEDRHERRGHTLVQASDRHPARGVKALKYLSFVGKLAGLVEDPFVGGIE